MGTLDAGRSVAGFRRSVPACPSHSRARYSVPRPPSVLDAARQLTKLVPESKLIFLTMHAAPTYATEAFKIGASGYLIKRSAASEL